MSKIIIADDEQKLLELLSEFFSDEGFTVLTACDGAQALKLFEQNPDTDLLILDVMMPYIDGWEVCRTIRKTSFVPIIMLTARSEEADELESFEKGANDYMPKPFSLSVLLARVNARISAGAPPVIAQGKLVINPETHEVTLDGEQILLTPIEYELLITLSRNKGKVYSREQLLTQIWGYDYYGGDRTVDTHVGRLRIKLREFGDKYIRTVRGYGYKFDVRG